MTASRPLIARPAVRTAILAHARRAKPAECCGFLVGAGQRVEFAVAVPNLSASPTRYRIDPAVHIALRRSLRQFAPPLNILGVYHSHPAGDAVPSPTDVSEALYPQWTYMIVGLKSPVQIRAFRLARGRVRERRIRWY